jgi:hypothetical protein
MADDLACPLNEAEFFHDASPYTALSNKELGISLFSNRNASREEMRKLLSC